MKLSHFKYLILLTFVVSTMACNTFKGRLVAEVNGHPIYASDVKDMMQLEQSKYDEILIALPDNAKELRRGALNSLIEESLLLDEANRKGLKVTKDETKSYFEEHFGTDDKDEIESKLEERGIDTKFWLTQQKRKLLTNKLIHQEVIDKIPVTEKEIRSFYSKNQNSFRRPLQYRARQILVDKREKAQEIAKRLENGEKFEDLAKRFSVSPDAKRGGDLGYFSTKDFPHVFSEICARLKVGDTSKVKETEYGFQIFQLVDKRRPKNLTLEEVRDQIVDSIRDERSAEALTKWFSDIRARGNIVINEEALEEVKFHAYVNKK
jgi:parvulin-like peptidyl-prolyl isomerase